MMTTDSSRGELGEADSLARAARPEIRYLLNCVLAQLAGNLAGNSASKQENKAPENWASTALSTMKRLETAPDFDWSWLAAYAQTHRLTPLLLKHLHQQPSATLPEPVLQSLTAIAQRINMRNLALSGQLLTILNRFEAAKVQAIPLKGPSLALRAYGHLPLRQFCDLDLLVHQQDALKARDVLVEMGYKSCYGYPRQQEARQLSSIYFKSYSYGHEGSNTTVDLHWKLLQAYLSLPLDYKQLWQQASPFTFCGQQVLSLSPNDTLLFACVHGSRDRWISLRLVSDVAAIVLSHSIDWAKLLSNSQTLGCQHRLLLGLRLAHGLVGVSLPDEVQKAIAANRSVEAFAQKISLHLCMRRSPTSKLQDTWFDWQIRERWQDKLTYSIYQPLLLATRRDGIAPTFI